MMLYERGSPPLHATHSPKWNSSRNHNAKARTIIIVVVVVLMLMGLGVLRSYSNTPANIDELDAPRDAKYALTNEMHAVAYSLPSVDEEEDLPATKQSILAHPPPGPPRLANATLNFEKIYVLNLETREDRRDEMALIAAASGLQLTFFPGVNSKALDTQSLPDSYGTDYVVLEPGHLACYRGHANIWRQIIEDDVETALIMEDDIDWDLNIREIIPRVEDALASITKDPDPMHDGHSWDILYLGTCYEEFFERGQYNESESDEVFVEIPDEDNLDPEIYDWVIDLLQAYYNDTSPRRVLVKGKNPVCTHGYAITQRAARRLLIELNDWLPFPVDITMIEYIDEGRFKAYSVLPPLMVQYRNTKDPKRNSDIEGDGVELERNFGILRSARKNVVDWVNLGLDGHRWWDGRPIISD